MKTLRHLFKTNALRAVSSVDADGDFVGLNF